MTRPIPPADRMGKLPPYLFGHLNTLAEIQRNKGVDVIDLGMGNPTDAAPPVVVDTLCSAVHTPGAHRYAKANGSDALRQALADTYAEQFGVDLDPESGIVATIGSKEGLSHLCLALLGAGDAVMVPTPAFPVHIWAPVIAGAEVVPLPFGDGQDLVEAVTKCCETRSPGPKLLILNYPHNPTAVLPEPGLFEEMVALARHYDFRILHDFAYSHLVYDNKKIPSFLSVPGATDVAVEFGSFSKTFNMAGWRLGWCCGNAQMVELLSRIKGYFDYGIFQPVQDAGVAALRHGIPHADRQRALYETRRNRFCDTLKQGGWEVTVPEAGMFVWTRLPEHVRHLGSMEVALRLVEDAGVVVTPGIGFGEKGEGFVRMAIVEDESRLVEAALRMGRAFMNMGKVVQAG